MSGGEPRLPRLALPAAVGWVLLLAFSAAWQARDIRSTAFNLAATEARTSYEKAQGDTTAGLGPEARLA